MFTIIVSNFIVLCDFIILSSDFYVGLMENNQFIQKKLMLLFIFSIITIPSVSAY